MYSLCLLVEIKGKKLFPIRRTSHKELQNIVGGKISLCPSLSGKISWPPNEVICWDDKHNPAGVRREAKTMMNHYKAFQSAFASPPTRGKTNKVRIPFFSSVSAPAATDPIGGGNSMQRNLPTSRLSNRHQ